MADSIVRGFPIEILSLVPGKCEGEPVAMLMVRAHTEHLRPVTFSLAASKRCSSETFWISTSIIQTVGSTCVRTCRGPLQ